MNEDPNITQPVTPVAPVVDKDIIQPTPQQVNMPLDPVTQQILRDYINQYLGASASFLVGDVKAISHSTVPVGWHLCDGTAISRIDYAPLFNLIGTSYGTGDGSTTFNLPDAQGKVIAMAGGGASLTVVGGSAGAERHNLSANELPVTSMRIYGGLNVGSGALPFIAPAGGAIGTNSQAGGGQADITFGNGNDHNNIQPTIVMNWIIKIQ